MHMQAILETQHHITPGKMVTIDKVNLFLRCKQRNWCIDCHLLRGVLIGIY